MFRLTFLVMVFLGLMCGGGVGVTDDAPNLGRELYVERCALCHGTDGHGWDWSKKVAQPPMPIPNLSKTVRDLDDRYLKRIILDGGEAVGRTRFMPAFRFGMKEKEAEALIRYLRSLSNSGS